MSDNEVSCQREIGADAGSQNPLTREQLYELVWKEPMVRISARWGVSSSYMARVCTDLQVPRPSRGYWAQREFGNAVPERPALPPVRPGDATVWSPGSALASPLPRVARSRVEARSARKLPKPADERHELLIGVKPHFLKTRKNEAGLLRPFKRLLVDVVTSENQLDTALSAANDLFLALEAKGHRVTFAPPGARMRRVEFDEREAPNKNHYHHGAWAPDRITVVYIGGVPIGLTLFETTEDIEMMYVHGTYIAVSELSATQLRRYDGPMHWKTKQSRVSGRFCLQAYCPHWMVAWKKQWRAASGKELSSLVPEVIEVLEATAPTLASQVADAEARAEIQRRDWEEERRREREEQERARQAKLRQDARNDLLAAIDAWSRTRSVQEWLAEVKREAEDLPEAERQHILAQVEQAEMLVGSADALELLKRWKSPVERR
jgi:hypothetical protein